MGRVERMVSRHWELLFAGRWIERMWATKDDQAVHYPPVWSSGNVYPFAIYSVSL